MDAAPRTSAIGATTEPAPQTPEPRRETASVEVLDPRGRLMAAFVSPLEAYRYATLISEPSFCPKLRRVADGDLLELASGVDMPAVRRWMERG